MAIRLILERRLQRRMQLWRAACIAILAAIYAMFWLGQQEMDRLEQELSVITDCSSTKYGRLWYCEAGDDRERWTEPLNEREQGIWNKVRDDARMHRFVFRDPVPVRTTAEADSFEPPSRGKIYGRAFWSGRILLSSQDMDRMTDGEVALMMAHELGHHIDLQNERMRHPVLNRLAYADGETVAWAVAAELYGGEAVERFRTKWQRRSVIDLLR